MKEELNSTTKTQQEHSIKIKALRSEAQLSIDVQNKQQIQAMIQKECGRNDTEEERSNNPSENYEIVSGNSKFHLHDDGAVDTKNDQTGDDMGNSSSSNVIHYREEEDKKVQHLQNKCSDLTTRLNEEIFNKNEIVREMNAKLNDANEAVNKSNGQVELVIMEMRNKQECHEMLVRKLKATVKILEAEIKSQKEYTEELTTNTWDDLISKVKVGVEEVTSQEMAKARIGVAKAVAACDNRWRKRFQEVNFALEENSVKLKKEYEQNLRSKESEFLIQIEEARAEVEARLQKQHTESMRATLNHTESRRQIDVKNEMKRWEQVCLIFHRIILMFKRQLNLLK